MNPGDSIVITGVSSFVGAHLATFLAGRGLRVHGGLSRSPGAYGGIRGQRVQWMAGAGVEFFQFNLLDPDGVVEQIHRIRPDYWITHAGWTKNYSNEDYDLDHAHFLHVAPFDRMFEALKATGCRGVINTGTSAEYGIGQDCFREDDACWPTTPYGLSKLNKTVRLQQLGVKHGLPYRVVRLFLPFGPLDAPDKLASSAVEALRGGRTFELGNARVARDFLHVADVCDGFLAVLRDFERGVPFDLFNLCSGRAVPLGDFVGMLADGLGVDRSRIVDRAADLRPGEALVHSGSNGKARRLLGWSPRSLEEGIAAYIEDSVTPQTAAPVEFPPTLVRLSRSSVKPEHVKRVNAAVNLGFLGMGKETEAFEKEIGEFLGGSDRHVMCVSTGTSALHLAVQACGIGPGDEVLVPTITYLASFQAISASGAVPVACDVRRDDALLDLADAARRITPRTRAVMPVHYASNPALLAEVYDFARKHGLRVIEDAAHAFGCRWHGEMVGATGDVICFSFDGIKNITSAEGGAVVTGDAEVAEKIRNARLLGVIKDTEKRYSGQRSWDFEVTEQGWRYHLSNVNAALGRAQLRSLPECFAPVRVRAATLYQELFATVPGLRLLPIQYGDIVPHIFPVFIEGGRRDEVQAALKARNIESGIHYKPNHLLDFYGGGRESLPVAEALYTEMLTLPLHAELCDREIHRVVDEVRKTLGA